MSDSKRPALSDFEGLDQWLAQFLEDPYADGLANSFRTDVYEISDQYIIEADLCTVFPKRLVICKDHSSLTIQSECCDGKLLESLVFLPFEIDSRTLNAKFQDGFLEIHVPKEEQSGKAGTNDRIIIQL
ncbi:hypothetical protein [Metabacillus sp. 84]|uniref:hypothetical protein n=1 Tax=Metabacillus sp. 84 TaxID=3404705 RepID=UPI003CEB4574